MPEEFVDRRPYPGGCPMQSCLAPESDVVPEVEPEAVVPRLAVDFLGKEYTVEEPAAVPDHPAVVVM